MEAFKNISLGIIHGTWDSIRGMTLLFYIDDEIHKLNWEKEEERRQRLLEQQRRMRNSPSPTPSSASAMERMHKESTPVKENQDERSIESIRNKPKPVEEAKPKGEKKIAKQVLKCCVLNGGFTWLSIILFEQVLLPTLKFVLTLCYGHRSEDLHMVWGWLQSVLSIIFGCMWVLPIFLLSKIVSSLWFADIANAAYRIRKGRPQMMSNISKLIADFLFSLVVQALFLVQSMLVNLVPVRYVGGILCFVHLCLLYSLYSFEYKWFNMGWELHRRLSYIENNWPYFLGFGAPLTVLTNMSDSLIVSSCIFSIFFPLFILSGNEAKIIVGTTETSLRLFSPVIFVSNLFFNRSGSMGRSQPKWDAAKYKSQQQQQQQQQQLNLVQRNKEKRDKLNRDNIRRSEEKFTSEMQAPILRSRGAQISRSEVTTTPMRHSGTEASRYVGGMRPLVPTVVSGAPSAPSTSSSTGRAAPSPHRR